MKEAFYRALEDKFRGSVELIKSRLKFYLPFIEPLKNIFDKPELNAVDLGCGRGEWLEILNENGFNALGLDIDEGMLKECRLRSLNALQTDIFDYLKTQPDESVILATGFHIAEHLPFENLLKLVRESLRILKPGGLLILESPNPENIVLGTTNFYIDPTHQRPLSPLLLSFVVEYSGFFRFKTVRLQERQNILEEDGMSIYDVLTGVSPDFAVIAQKKADEKISSRFDSVFAKEYGADLNKIAGKYDNSVKTEFNDLKNWREISVRFTEELDFIRSEYRIKEQNLQAELNRTNEYWQNTVNNLNGELNRTNEYWQNTVNNLQNELKSVYTGKSWRITKPLRFAMKAIKKIVRILKSVIKKFLTYFKKIIDKMPVLKKPLLKILNKFPGIKNKLRSISVAPAQNVDAADAARNINDGGLSSLTAQEKQVYLKLKDELTRVKD